MYPTQRTDLVHDPDARRRLEGSLFDRKILLIHFVDHVSLHDEEVVIVLDDRCG